jgi:hypothetical protein
MTKWLGGSWTTLLVGWLASGCAAVKATSVYARAVAEQAEECGELASAGDAAVLAECRQRLAVLRELADFEESELEGLSQPLVPPRNRDIDTVDLRANWLASHR